MVEANLNGPQTKNCVNCINIEAVIKECVLEEQEKNVVVPKKNDLNKFQFPERSKSFKKLLSKGKYNNKYMIELKNIKYVKSQVQYRNFGTY
ncbi:MAG: hypothetical protein ACFFD5_15955 [Candidatus Thorarchaeota archaeon]